VSDHPIKVGSDVSDDTRDGLRLLMEVVASNDEAIATIVATGEIALVAVAPDAKWCQALGMPGMPNPSKSTVTMKMPPSLRRSLIDHGDSVTSRWSRGGRTGRLFAIVQSGSFLLNWTGQGWATEPGSLDSEAS
jgi:hypothetical protein